MTHKYITMRYIDLVDTYLHQQYLELLEARMTGKEFKRKLNTVKIGFEFEVCLPYESIHTPLDVPTTLTYLETTTLSTLVSHYGNSFLERADEVFRVNYKKIAPEYLPDMARARPDAKLKISAYYGAWLDSKKKQLLKPLIPQMLEVIKYYLLEIRRIQNIDDSTDRAKDEAKRSIEEYIQYADSLGVTIDPDSYDAKDRGTTDANALFQNFSDKARIKYLQLHSPVDNMWERLRIALNDMRSTQEATLYDITDNPDHIPEFCETVFGTANLGKLVSSKVWILRTSTTKPKAEALKRLFYFVTPSAAPPRDSVDIRNLNSNNYKRSAATEVAAVLKPLFGKIEIFNSYHQQAKKLDRWYIEPDGSLRPNLPDYSMEIVGPPKPVKEALADLENFSKVAEQLKLYTNESTGLHINISISDDIDPLKLAIFSNDTDALKTFGRLDSDHGQRYAASIIRRLKNKIDFNPLIHGQKSYERWLRDLQTVASNIGHDHFSSISLAGKYISFRHAGGDYLKKIPELMRVIKNFVRAMVIASDENAYQQEYMNKLIKMADLKPLSDTSSVIQDMRLNGVPILRVYAMTYNQQPYDKVVSDINSNTRRGRSDLNQTVLVQQESGDNIKRKMLDRDTGYIQSTRDRINAAMDEQLYQAIVVPNDLTNMMSIKMLTDDVAGLYDSDGNKIGVFRMIPDVLRRGDPQFIPALQRLVQSARAKSRLGS